MTAMTKRVLAVVVAAVLASAAGVAAGEADVAWIGQLPGLSLQTSSTTAAYGFKAIYTISAGADGTLDSVRKGLTERGWTITRDADLPAGDVGVRTVSAHKDGARVKVAVTSVMGVGTLTVSLSGRAAGSPSAAGTTDRAPDSGGAEASSGGEDGLTIAGRAVRMTRSCGGGDVSVTASSSEITLRGACGTVKVVGNANTVTVDASVKEIHAVGRANTIVWSASRNTAAPVVKHLGSQNRVRSDAE